MFGHLVIKEWKERWTLAVFGVGGVLAGFAIAAWAWSRVREAPAYLLGAMYLIFFPVFGALLGATGFEAEFRNGAWAYLLSRPVKRTTIWLAKFLALLSILVFVGLLSFGLVSASAKLKAAASTLTAPGLGGGNDPLISMLVVGFGLSLLTFALAFAMSLLTERAITVTAVSLFLGFAVYGGWLYGFAAASGLLLSRFQPGLIWVGLILSGLVPLVASLETFRKADFSQPRRKAGFFWRRAGVLFLLAVVVVALVAVWPPVRGRWISLECTDAGNLYFNTSKGSFVYSAAKDRTERLRLPVVGRYIHIASARAGKLAGFEATRRGESFFIARTDGSEKVALTGPKAKDPRLKDIPFSSPLLSPDGRAVAFSSFPRLRSSRKTPTPELWLVSDQGELLKHTAVVLPEFSPEDYSHLYVYLAGWPQGTNLVLFNLHSSSRETEKPNYIMAWDIDQNEMRILARSAMLGLSYRSTPDDIIPARRRSADGTGWTLSLLSLGTAFLTDIWTETNLVAEFASVRYVTGLSPDGQKLSFLVDRDNPPRCVLGIYGWPEQKIISQRDLSRKDIRYTELAWTPDGREVVIRNLGRKGLEFFDEKLEPTRFVTYPEGRDFYGLKAVGDKLLISDFRADRLWRLDLKTEQWKRVY